MKRSIIRMCMWIENELMFRTNDSTLIEYKALLTTLFDNIQKNGCIQVEVFLLKTTTIHRQFPFFFPRIFNKLIRFWIFYTTSKYYPFVKIWKIQMTRAFIYSIVCGRWTQLISLGPEVPFTSLDMNNLAKNILNLEKENKKIEERIQYLEQALNEYVIILRNNPLVLNAILWLSTILLSTSIHPQRFQNPYMERLINSSSILMNESLVAFFSLFVLLCILEYEGSGLHDVNKHIVSFRFILVINSIVRLWCYQSCLQTSHQQHTSTIIKELLFVGKNKGYCICQ